MADRILIVDDDPSILQVLNFFLSQEGYDVIQATDGTEALEFTRQFQPGLIVLDYMLPDINGIEVCQRVRTNVDIPQPQIIMCTAETRALDRVRSLLAGANDYVAKPLDFNDLVARVKALLHRPSAGPGQFAFGNN